MVGKRLLYDHVLETTLTHVARRILCRCDLQERHNPSRACAVLCEFLPLSVSIGPPPEVRRDVTNRREVKPDQDSRSCKQCLISEGLCTEKADEATTRQIVRSDFVMSLGVVRVLSKRIAEQMSKRTDRATQRVYSEWCDCTITRGPRGTERQHIYNTWDCMRPSV